MNVLLAIGRDGPRLALELLLSEEPGITILGAVSETEGLLALTRILCADLVVMEWSLPGRPAPDVLAQARALASQPKFLVLGQDAQLKPCALQAGAAAFVLVGDPPERLLDSLRQVRTMLRRAGGASVNR
jgi:DNA-binding NarL/FixJ family response regulator